VRQLADEDVVPPIETIGTVRSHLRSLVEGEGIEFIEETTGTQPGPTQWAAVVLDDGSQFLLQHHNAHPESFVELGAQMGPESPAELCYRFAGVLGLNDEDFEWIADAWPGGLDRLDELRNLLRNVKLGPATADVRPLFRAAANHRITLPWEYVALMMEHDGGEGEVGQAWLQLWDVARITSTATADPARYEACCSSLATEQTRCTGSTPQEMERSWKGTGSGWDATS
jgi:hypothetical protein